MKKNSFFFLNIIMQFTFEALAYNHSDQEVKTEVMEALQTRYNVKNLQRLVLGTLINFKDPANFQVTSDSIHEKQIMHSKEICFCQEVLQEKVEHWVAKHTGLDLVYLLQEEIDKMSVFSRVFSSPFSSRFLLHLLSLVADGQEPRDLLGLFERWVYYTKP